MTGADAIAVIARVEGAGIGVWVDGGWGIDALLGRETPAHSDLDLVVRRRELDASHAALAQAGFVHARDEWPGLPARLVLRDEYGRRVDFHPIAIDEHGQGWQTLDDGRFGRHPAEGLQGAGRIAGRPVKCLTPELQRRHHRGYELPEHERRDLEVLAEHFGLR